MSPVRIKSLEDFGTPQFVADKLINAEKRKVRLKTQNKILVKCVEKLNVVLLN